jgi:hypothetical protein
MEEMALISAANRVLFEPDEYIAQHSGVALTFHHRGGTFYCPIRWVELL